MPTIKGVYQVAMSIASVIAVGLASGGSAAAQDAEKRERVKLRPDSPGNIRTETCSRPEYPEQERAQNHQGMVTLRFLIGADGVVKRSLVQVSSGYPALDEAALSAISKCRFNPPVYQGKPAEGWTAIQYVWKP